MAANKKKVEEKHLKMLREMVSLPSNKQCFDCSQRGPTYVNMTIGSFVCTSCSGILRGLHPPHRIKSISMASFTPEEIDFLLSHGNEFNRKVYMGSYDSQSGLEPNSRDEQRIRDHMTQKYENKRWYVAPTDNLKEVTKWMNEAAINSKPQVKTLRSLLGENATKITPTVSQASPVSHAPVQVSVPLPGVVKPVTAAAASKTPSGFDLLGDLGGDPFASSAPDNNSNGNVQGFADFSSFGSFNSSPSHQPPATAAQAHAPLAFPSQVFPVSATPLQPLARGQAPTPIASHQTPTQTFSFGGDKYAALSDLVTPAVSTPVTAATAVNWGGEDKATFNWGASDKGTINWGTPSSAAGTSSQIASGTFNWNSQGTSSVSMATTVSHGGFGVPSHGNPFGGASAGGVQSYPAASASTGNPFGSSMSHFSQTVPSAAGYNVAPIQGQVGGYGQFPAMQNGGFGINPSPVGYGAPAFTQQHFTPGQQSAMWGQFGASPSVANPFLNTPTQQNVPPPSGSTNPFL